jgi:iron complex outermembrane receptor protein
MKPYLGFPALAVGMLVHGGPAVTQPLDYGKLEGMFEEPVTISATGKPERVSDTLAVMDIITADDIRRSGARDLPTLLERLPGVTVAHTAPGAAEVGLGGYILHVGSRVMVLLNGRQIYFDGYGEVYWSAIPVEMQEIRQIEVIRGPQSALYGFDAVDGVINIVTFDPVTDKVDSAHVTWGKAGRRDFSASVTPTLAEGLGVRLTVTDDHANDAGIEAVTRLLTRYRVNPDRRMADLSLGYVLPDGSRASLEGAHSQAYQRSAVYGVPVDTQIVTNSAKAGFVEETGYGLLNASLSYTEVALPWVRFVATNSFSVLDETLAGQISDVVKVGQVDTLRIGLDGRHGVVDGGAATGGTVSGDLEAVSGMWTHQVTRGASMVNAVRYDFFALGRTGTPVPGDIYRNAQFDRSVDGYSVNSAIIDKIGDQDGLKLVFARGLDLPSLSTYSRVEHFLPAFGGYYFYGRPYLNPTPVYSYQVAWDHQFDGQATSARVTLSHDMTMKHFEALYVVVGGALAQITTASTGSIANGAVLQIGHTARQGLSWGLNYTYRRLHEHMNWGLRDAAPINKVNAKIGYGWDDWDADLRLTFTSSTKYLVALPGRRPTLAAMPIAGHLSLAPRIAWYAGNRITVELSADNLWPYSDVFGQRNPVEALLSVTVAY